MIKHIILKCVTFWCYSFQVYGTRTPVYKKTTMFKDLQLFLYHMGNRRSAKFSQTLGV